MDGPGAVPRPSTGQLMDQKTPRPQFQQPVPAAERMPRERLVAIANSYFTGLANQTGRFTAPFAETCERWENGNQTTHQKPNPATAPGGLDIHISELFQIRNGKIDQIEAVINSVPYAMKSDVWDE